MQDKNLEELIVEGVDGDIPSILVLGIIVDMLILCKLNIY